MTSSRWSPLLSAFLLTWLPSPSVAQDDFWALLQEQPLIVTVAELIANDLSASSSIGLNPVGLPEIDITRSPAHGVLTIDGGEIVYQPNQHFFGVDSFRYSWTHSAEVIEGEVELFVAPWITPLAGPMGLLDPGTDPGPDGLGYYNSMSGIFYFCPLSPAPLPDGFLTCVTYHYPDAEPGWLPLLGTWETGAGLYRPNRPGLYDPTSRRVYLLDEDSTGLGSSGSSATRTLVVIEQFELGGTKPRAVIPIAADLDGAGTDAVVSFLPGEHRFEADLLEIAASPDDRLWPMAVPSTTAFEQLAVFDLDTGLLQTGATKTPMPLWARAASLATARLDGSTVVHEVYDAARHALSTSKPTCPPGDGPTDPDGTQVVRFPNDPDPPPNVPVALCEQP